MSVLNDVGDVFGGAILSGWEGVCWGVILVFCPPIFGGGFLGINWIFLRGKLDISITA